MHFSKSFVSSLAVIGAAARPITTTGDNLSPSTTTTVVSPLSPSPAVDMTLEAEGGLPPILAPVLGAGPDLVTQKLLADALKNVLSKDLAKLCQGADERAVFAKMLAFLSHLNLGSLLPKDGSPKEILEHLVMYVNALDEMAKKQMPFKFPEDIVGLLRSALGLARQTGALQGDALQVLQTLNAVFDDVCAGTGKATE